MREILFRGRMPQTGKWAYGCLLYWAGKAQVWEYDQYGATHNYIVDSDTVGQYTGLDDKKGVKIFEGDIVEYEDSNRSCLNRDDGKDITQIVWDDGALVLADGYPKHLGEYGGEVFEVIGNIHDNPELLEEKENDKDT